VPEVSDSTISAPLLLVERVFGIHPVDGTFSDHIRTTRRAFKRLVIFTRLGMALDLLAAIRDRGDRTG
jgi:hypothetical protein